MDYINGFFEHLWILSVDAAPYLLVGFGIAALLHLYLPTHLLLRLLGEGRFRPTLTAALIGIPLPLCSCSVVPTAVAVREKGASPGATLSFFISTPETGVDSILLTYGMMGPIGPVMAVARPLAAGLSALSAGIFLDFFGGSLEKNLGASAGYNFLAFTFTGVFAQTLFQSTALGVISLIADRAARIVSWANTAGRREASSIR